MSPITEEQLKAYKDIFPELARDQLETAVLFAMGISEKILHFFDLLPMSQLGKQLRE